MSTQVTTTFDADPDYDKVITVKRGEITMEDWIATLDVGEQQEWRKQHDIHEAAVHAAVDAGDAEVHTPDPKNATIKWKSQEIHVYWMNTISADDNTSYHSFWARYHAAMEERNKQ
jgi:hypothetical protein